MGGLKGLAVHGSLEDNYWKAIGPQNLRGEYADYDMVFGGHSHYSHVFTKFYPVENPELRNKKAVIFINPGSVGQPRNINPCAQFGILNTATTEYEHVCVPYDIVAEQELYTDEVDVFYKDRLTLGI